MIINTGESCGEGSIETLQSRISDNNLEYSCYDVFGDPTDQSQWQDLSVCASKIITAVQQGTTLSLSTQTLYIILLYYVDGVNKYCPSL